jgi:cation diffusion facilitator CzcD-associated flavoprotein CzcO
MAGLPNRPEDFSTAAHAASYLSKADGVGNASTNGDTANGAKHDVQSSENIDVDVLIIGGGFTGVYGIHNFRKLGLSVKVFDAGSDFGGTWHWNRYPGARVDSESPYYTLTIPEVYKDWYWKERFPGHEELREYFAHASKVLDLRRDANFSKVVTSASFDTEQGKWNVHTADGSTAKCTYLVMGTGSTSKMYYPDFRDLNRYKGYLVHTARWPKQSVDIEGKRICVIGSGATGVQVVQTLARENCDLTMCVRTPNTAIPMRQRQMSREEQISPKCFYQSILMGARDCWGGFPYNPAPKHWTEATPEERQTFYEELWLKGGFSFFVSNYIELLNDREINKEIYAFWAKKTRARIQDPIKRDIMAPLKQPHWIFTKRPSLEQDYYEMVDRDNVTVMDLKTHPIERFTEEGIIFSGDKERKFDMIICATGYDNVSGSLFDAGLVDTDGVKLTEKWKNGIYTYMGLMVNKMPNMFMIYSPQAPTALSNGPPLIEIQIEWIGRAIQKMRTEGVKYIDAQAAAAECWRDEVQAISNETLYPETDSWFMGANIPGKPREQLIYLGGLNVYNRRTNDALDGWKGFDVFQS